MNGKNINRIIPRLWQIGLLNLAVAIQHGLEQKQHCLLHCCASSSVSPARQSLAGSIPVLLLHQISDPFSKIKFSTSLSTLLSEGQSLCELFLDSSCVLILGSQV